MKKITLSLVMITIALTVIAQTPQAFKYQAVARDNGGNVLANQNVSFQISILEGSTSGTAVYVETHDTITNEFGLVNLEIGNGVVVSGVFEEVDWGDGLYFLQIEMDETGGTTYQLMGTSQLLSVPYSLYSESTGDTTRWKKNNEDLYFNNGNVGIGTDSPFSWAKLDVRGNFSVDGFALISRMDGSEAILDLYNTISDWELVAASDNNRFDIRKWGGVPALSISDNNYIGIGTENPSYKFEVKWEPPSSNINPIALFQTTGSTSSAAAVRVQNTSDNFFNFGMTHPGNNNFSIAYNANIGLSTDLMTITQTGNVGIGTGNPEESALLDLNSNSKGMLIPRMTQAEIAAITNPANGLQAFNTDDGILYIYILAENKWKEVQYGTGEILPSASYTIGTGGSCANTNVNGNYY